MKRAEKEIAHSDGSRCAFVRRYFQAEMEDPARYDLVLNTQHLGFEDAASISIHALQFKDSK
jgi:cytidylate kinase